MRSSRGSDVDASDAQSGRIIDLTEGHEERLVDLMRDIDGVVAAAGRLYPGHTWSRSEIMELFFHDLMSDQLQTMIDVGQE